MTGTKKPSSKKGKTQPIGDGQGSHFQMHEEHRQWCADLASWQDDLVQWQAECRKLVAEAKQFELMVQDHEKLLVSHSEDINAHRIKLASHEHALTEYEKGDTGGPLIKLSRDHSVETERHNKGQSLHSAIKQRHRALVAQWNHLRKELEQIPAKPC